VDREGRIVVSRKRMQFEIWKFPVEGDAVENVRQAVRITHQTGQVQTPTLDPRDRELAYSRIMEAMATSGYCPGGRRTASDHVQKRPRRDYVRSGLLRGISLLLPPAVVRAMRAEWDIGGSIRTGAASILLSH
jgi:hypothetical protein